MCHISGLLFSQSSRQQSLWLPRGQKLFLSGQMEKLANISKPHVKKRKLKLLLAGFPFQSFFFFSSKNPLGLPEALYLYRPKYQL